MKRKILSIALIFIMFFANYAIADETIALQFTREGGSKTYDIATKINNELYLDEKFNAYSEKVTTSDVSIYSYNTTTELTNSGTTPIDYEENRDKYYLSTFTTDRK